MTLRLCATVVSDWELLDGYAVAHGMPDLREIPLGRLCSFVYWRAVDGADSKEVEKLRARLWKPPKGEMPDPRSPWSAENESKGFAAFTSQIGQKAKVTQAAPIAEK